MADLVTETIGMKPSRPPDLSADRQSVSKSTTVVPDGRSGEQPNVVASLVICSRDRCDVLARCLSALETVSLPPEWEVVIVNNGSRDHTIDVIEEFQARVSFRVISVNEPLPGLSRARNRGMTASSGRIIAFTDDDCYVTPEYAAHLLAAFDEPRLGYLTGKVQQYDPRFACTAINERSEPYELRPYGYVRTGRVLGANMAFRREVLEAIGGFDLEFGSGARFPAEDCDAAARASAAGWAGRYVPEVVVQHDHRRDLAEARTVHYSYDLGRGAYHMKLISQSGTRLAGVRGWLELPYRVFRRPTTLRGEVAGAWGWWRLNWTRRRSRR